MENLEKVVALQHAVILSKGWRHSAKSWKLALTATLHLNCVVFFFLDKVLRVVSKLGNRALIVQGVEVTNLEICYLEKVHPAQVVVPVKMHKVTKVRLIRLHLQTVQKHTLLQHILALLDVHWIVKLNFEERLLILVEAIDGISIYHLNIVDILVISALKFLL